MKMNMFKRVLSVVLVLIMTFSLVACANVGNEDTKPDGTAGTSGGREHVTLIMYTYGPNQPGRQDMIDALNEYLLEKLNVTLDLRLSTDFSKTMSTRIDAGEDWDICLVGNGVNFQDYARRNAFAPLTEYLDLMPGTTGQLNKTGMSAFTINDEIYGVPVLKDSFTSNSLNINQDLLEDLGLEIPEYATMMDLVDFLLNAKKVKDQKYPDDENIPLFKDVYGDYDMWTVGERIVGSWDYPLVYVNIDEENGYEGISLNDTAFCPFYTQEYRDIMKAVYKLVDAGVGAFDPTTYDADMVLRKSGKLLGELTSGLVEVSEDQYPDFKSALYPSTVRYASPYTMGFAVNAKCKNVERAVEVLELLQNDTYAATTAHFGPEGKGWTDTNNDNVIELTEQNSNPSDRYWYMWYGWQIGGVTALKAIPGYSTNYFEKVKDMNKNSDPKPNAGFVFDSEPVASQMAAVANVYAEYHKTLKLGQNSNVDELIDQFVEELKANGMDDIVSEAQRQLDAWRAENGK